MAISAVDVKEALDQNMAGIDEFFLKILPPAVKQPLEEKKIRPSMIVLGIFSVIALYFLFFLEQEGQNAYVNFACFVYPFYKTLKNIKTEGHDDDTLWLMYWVVYAMLNMIESVSDILYYWIPLYYSLKVVFLIWCFLPQTQGAMVIWLKLLDPLVTKYLSSGSTGDDPSVTRTVIDDKTE